MEILNNFQYDDNMNKYQNAFNLITLLNNGGHLTFVGRNDVQTHMDRKLKRMKVLLNSGNVNQVFNIINDINTLILSEIDNNEHIFYAFEFLCNLHHKVIFDNKISIIEYACKHDSFDIFINVYDIIDDEDKLIATEIAKKYNADSILQAILFIT